MTEDFWTVFLAAFVGGLCFGAGVGFAVGIIQANKAVDEIAALYRQAHKELTEKYSRSMDLLMDQIGDKP